MKDLLCLRRRIKDFAHQHGRRRGRRRTRWWRRNSQIVVVIIVASSGGHDYHIMSRHITSHSSSTQTLQVTRGKSRNRMNVEGASNGLDEVRAYKVRVRFVSFRSTIGRTFYARLFCSRTPTRIDSTRENLVAKEAQAKKKERKCTFRRQKPDPQ